MKSSLLSLTQALASFGSVPRVAYMAAQLGRGLRVLLLTGLLTLGNVRCAVQHQSDFSVSAPSAEATGDEDKLGPIPVPYLLILIAIVYFLQLCLDLEPGEDCTSISACDSLRTRYGLDADDALHPAKWVSLAARATADSSRPDPQPCLSAMAATLSAGTKARLQVRMRSALDRLPFSHLVGQLRQELDAFFVLRLGLSRL